MTNREASFVSVALHPGLVPTGLFAVLMAQGERLMPTDWTFRLTLLGLVLNFTFILPLLMVLMLYLRGHLSSIRMPSRQERLIPFMLAGICYLLLVYLFRVRLDGMWQLSQLMTAMALTQAISTLVTVRYKISIHCTALGGALGALAGMQVAMPELDLLYPMAAAVGLLGLAGTARLQLNAHTPGQVGWGMVLGFAVNAGAMLLLG
jgi:hypothetical protein